MIARVAFFLLTLTGLAVLTVKRGKEEVSLVVAPTQVRTPSQAQERVAVMMKNPALAEAMSDVVELSRKAPLVKIEDLEGHSVRVHHFDVVLRHFRSLPVLYPDAERLVNRWKTAANESEEISAEVAFIHDVTGKPGALDEVEALLLKLSAREDGEALARWASLGARAASLSNEARAHLERELNQVDNERQPRLKKTLERVLGRH